MNKELSNLQKKYEGIKKKDFKKISKKDEDIIDFYCNLWQVDTDSIFSNYNRKTIIEDIHKKNKY